LFRRDTAKIGEDGEAENGINELVRPKSQDTQTSGDPSALTTGSAEDISIDGGITPEKKKKEKKKKDKGKSKSLFRWDSKPDIPTEDPEIASLESVKDDHESEETPKKKKKRGKKGVKFEKEEETSPARTSQETTAAGPYYYQGREVTLDEVPVKVLDYFR
jgi:hypothetical protein